MRSPTQQEEARLRSLVDYRLLDSGAESDFDQLVQLALKMGQVPMALISLVDRDRQWLKARVGVETAQGERSAYFANEILKKAEPLVLENIEPADGLGLRFFAGFPLINAEGFTLGFLAVMDRQPHKLTPDQVQSLKVLADQAVQLMELRKANVRVLESARILSKYTRIIEDQQETLIQTAKMSSLGSMAAGIAHEIN
ncbi:MAG: GAF domain-containing protein, partial [Bdellovibrionales bacterium]